MSWVEASEGGPRQVLIAIFKGDQWTKPRSIVTGDRLMLNWADFPSISAFSGLIASHWLERGGSNDGSYQLKIGLGAVGERKSQTVFVAPPQTADGYTGFLSFTSFENRLFAAFLHNKESGTSLRMVQITPDGRLLKEEVLDTDVCSCCQTAAAVTVNGPVVIYRDHEVGQIRDISVVRFEKGAWTEPVPLNRDGWQINACPVNGPSIIARGTFVAVAWYTGGQENPRVLTSTSTDSGRSFTPPLRIDGGKPIGRVSIAISEGVGKAKPSAVVTWLERLDDQSAAVQVRELREKNGLSRAVTVGRVSSGRLSGFPRIAITGDTLFLAWTEDRIKTVKMAVAGVSVQ